MQNTYKIETENTTVYATGPSLAVVAIGLENYGVRAISIRALTVDQLEKEVNALALIDSTLRIAYRF